MLKMIVQTRHGAIRVTLDRDDPRVDVPECGTTVEAAPDGAAAMPLAQFRELMLQYLLGTA